MKKIVYFLLIALFASASLTAQTVTINFDNDALGNAISAGQFIDDEYAAQGVTISSSYKHAMAFDSENPTGGDPDLGSPNEDFGGPGVGNGGGIGEPYENSSALGNILIISTDDDQSDPNDHAGGGVLTFTFDNPVYVNSTSSLDDLADTEARAFDSSNNPLGTISMNVPGENSYANHSINIDNVSRLEIDLGGSGAIPNLKFTPAFDWGDAPDSYGTTSGSSGPNHILSSKLNFNGLPDAESGGIPTASADGDDNDANDDENGLVLINDSNSTSGTVIYTLRVTNTTGQTATVYGWMDLNKNGTFESSEKQTTTTSTSGDVTLTFNHTTSLSGTYMCRFRVSLASNLGPTGAGQIGEVEDHTAAFAGGLDVEFSDFEAELENRNVTIHWNAVEASNHAGYNVLRKVDENDFVKINTSLIAPSFIGTAENTYKYVDELEYSGLYTYKIEAMSTTGEISYSDPITVTFGLSSVDDLITLHEFRLNQNYPNPFNPHTTIGFEIAESGWVELTVFDLSGKTIKTLWNGTTLSGSYSITWDGLDNENNQVATGIYFYQLKTEAFSNIKRMTLIK